MALKDERSPKYAFPEAGTSLLKSPRKSLLAAAAAAAGGAADPSKKAGFRQGNPMLLKDAGKTRPSRTGKHHGPEGRMESKIGVSRGRNVPSEIS